MSDCIFCKLANGEIPTATLYEDDDFRIILDAGPATKGHCLILPKEHYQNMLLCTFLSLMSSCWNLYRYIIICYVHALKIQFQVPPQ